MQSWFRHSYYQSDDTAEHVVSRLGALIDDLALDHFSYALLRAPKGYDVDLNGTFFTSYPTEWITRYLRRQYLTLDPVCERTQNTTRPFTWGHGRFLRKYRKQQRHVFNEAREFQIMTGLSIPIHGARGEVGTFNVVSSDARHLTEATRSEHERLFQAAFDTHDIVLADTMASATCREVPINLSVREKECLLWTLEGKTAEDVASILGLSVFTVNHHASTATKKMNCVNKHHAAVQALRAGLI